jgi:hypothetical protein
MNLKKIGFSNVDWLEMAQDWFKWWAYIYLTFGLQYQFCKLPRAYLMLRILMKILNTGSYFRRSVHEPVVQHLHSIFQSEMKNLRVSRMKVILILVSVLGSFWISV